MSDEHLQRVAALGYDYAAQPKEYVQVCNLCGSTHFVTISYADRYGFPAQMVVCAECGLGLLSPRMTAEAYARFYDCAYRPLLSTYYGRRIDEETIQDEQAVYAGEYVWKLLEPHMKDALIKTLLDIGGSTGVVSRELQEFLKAQGQYVRVTVLDPAPLEAAVAARLGFESLVGLVEDFDPGERRWDLVILCQTIDHLLDIRNSLDKIRALIAEDGFFFFDIVNWEYVRNRQGTITDSVKIDHPFYLTKRTALAFARQSGFKVVTEAVSPDGHLIGFLCIPTAKKHLDRDELRQHAEETLRDIRAIQAQELDTL